MTLIIFKYGLSILLGYVLFMAISGRLMPFSRPESLVARPRWFLGLWIGISCAVITMIGFELAYKADWAELPNMIKPGLWLVAIVTIPGIALFSMYRSHVKHQLAASRNSTIDTSPLKAVESDNNQANANSGIAPDEQFDATVKISDMMVLDESALNINEQYSSWETDPSNDLSDKSSIGFSTDMAANMASKEEPTNESLDAPLVMVAPSLTDGQADELADATVNKHAVEQEQTAAEEHLSARDKAANDKLASGNELEHEYDATLNLDMLETDPTTNLNALNMGVGSSANQESLAAQPSSRLNDVEAGDLAMSTASKAVTIATQAVQIRARLESQLKDAKAKLASNETVINNLKRALDREKSRNQNSVQALAKQLVMHEKQLAARQPTATYQTSDEIDKINQMLSTAAKGR